MKKLLEDIKMLKAQRAMWGSYSEMKCCPILTSLATVCQCRWLSHWSIRSWCRNLHLSGTSRASLTNSPTAKLINQYQAVSTSIFVVTCNINTPCTICICKCMCHLPRQRYGTTMCVWLRHCLRPFLHQFWMLTGWLASTTFVIWSSGYTCSKMGDAYVRSHFNLCLCLGCCLLHCP